MPGRCADPRQRPRRSLSSHVRLRLRTVRRQRLSLCPARRARKVGALPLRVDTACGRRRPQQRPINISVRRAHSQSSFHIHLPLRKLKSHRLLFSAIKLLLLGITPTPFDQASFPVAMSSNGTERQAAQAQSQRPPAVSAEMQKVFSRFDADGDGRISPSELAAVNRAISPPPTSSHGGREVAAMMDELDTDRDGYVDLGEFAAFHERARDGDGDGELEAELRAAFDVYDVNGDGRITAAELGKVLAQIGEGCSAEECERMIAGVDVDGDGCVGFEEFKKMMAPKGSAAEPAAPHADDKAKKE